MDSCLATQTDGPSFRSVDMLYRLILCIIIVASLSGCGGDVYPDYSLDISPSYVYMHKGETLQFEITSSNSSIGISDDVKWITDGGWIFSIGGQTATFTAGNKTGTYTVYASCKKLYGAAEVHIY